MYDSDMRVNQLQQLNVELEVNLLEWVERAASISGQFPVQKTS
jgi:hypothetical protein